MSNLGLQRKILSSEMVNFPVCLAPMVGLSHMAMRMVCRKYMPANAKTIWPTEMLNSRRIPDEIMNQKPENTKHDSELDLVPQILGNEEPFVSKSVQKLKDWGAIGVDINMGCPVKKALKHNYGVALMGDMDYARQVVDMAANNGLPVSVKLRAGHQNDLDFLMKFVNGLVDAGAEWICLHPRIAKMKRRGRADWSQIKYLRDATSVPIVGNGDIQVADDAIKMLNDTDCDMVMIGRALTARPWMLWQIGRQLGFDDPEGLSGEPPSTATDEAQEYGRSLIYLLDEFEGLFPEILGIRRFNFYLKVSHVWLDFGHRLCAKAAMAKNYAEMRSVLLDFFENKTLRYSQRTDLRY